MPKSPKFDPIAALYCAVSLGRRERLENVTVLFDGEEPDASLAHEMPVDLDARLRRTETGHGSAVERVVQMYQLDEVMGTKRLVVLANRNNETGYLKERFRDSLVNLMFLAPSVAHSVSRREHLLECIRMAWPVFDLYFQAGQRAFHGKRWREFCDIPNPFCLAGYDAMVEFLRPDERGRYIQHRLVLVQWFERVRGREAQAAKRAVEARYTEFLVSTVSGGTVVGRLVESDDETMAGQYFRSHPGVEVVLVRKSTGHAGIFVRGVQDLRPLHEALQRRDADRWDFVQKPGKSPMLLNGSRTRHTHPSRLGPSELITTVQAHLRFRLRQKPDAEQAAS
ncbi:MAG: hypothetical protein HYY50_04955 [Candidatus Kerfeldbacteria bacterium]|nr:hypothetical protein [Candidatus Kerfeldbacteria bacterium]